MKSLDIWLLSTQDVVFWCRWRCFLVTVFSHLLHSIVASPGGSGSEPKAWWRFLFFFCILPQPCDVALTSASEEVGQGPAQRFFSSSPDKCLRILCRIIRWPRCNRSKKLYRGPCKYHQTLINLSRLPSLFYPHRQDRKKTLVSGWQHARYQCDNSTNLES